MSGARVADALSGEERTAPAKGCFGVIERKLSGKVAVVTGGARGLGRGYALRLARLGADIAIIDRNLGSAQVYALEREVMTAATVMAECAAHGVRAMGIAADVADREAATAAIAAIVKELGRLDVAVCNAGGGTVVFADERSDGGDADLVTTGTPSDCTEEMLTRVLDNNLKATMYTCMAVAPHMKRQRAGKIITVASTAGVDARGAYHPYGTAKAAIIHYTRALAQELGPFNITVNAIAPGIIRTGRLGDRSHLAGQIPLRREGSIEDCAKVVEFLATDLADYVTGRTIVIDGGLLR
jgi:3-oxoacyl-[acyl-carrier protein] reductase